jgi:MFS family permease
MRSLKIQQQQEEASQLCVILLIVFIGFAGTSMAYPIFPPLFLDPTQSSWIPRHWSASTRNLLLGLALASYPFGQFIGAPTLGSLSDHYGRKRILTISLVGSTLGYSLCAMALSLNLVGLLILSRFLTGLIEGNVILVQAMAVDLKTLVKAKTLGRINGYASIGYVTGPLLGGALSDPNIHPTFSFALPFWCAAFFCFITLLLTLFKLQETHVHRHNTVRSGSTFKKQFSLIQRFKILFQNPLLKHFLIVSALFTFCVDIFYEFGPVYLTAFWNMTPAGIALYNAALSFGLAIGSTWLYSLALSKLSDLLILMLSMVLTCIAVSLTMVVPSKMIVFLLFGLAGMTIAVANSQLILSVSNAAAKTIQGEAIGAQFSLRMLGDACICLIGGFMITESITLPLFIGSIIGLISALIHYQFHRSREI